MTSLTFIYIATTSSSVWLDNAMKFLVCVFFKFLSWLTGNNLSFVYFSSLHPPWKLFNNIHDFHNGGARVRAGARCMETRSVGPKRCIANR